MDKKYGVPGALFGLRRRREKLALDVVKTAVAENPQGTLEEWQRFVRTWAKENGSREYRPGYWKGYELTYENNDYLRSIGRL